MVSDSELAEKVHEFLCGSDLKKTTNNIVIQKLESDFGVDLSHKKPFLRTQVDRFLQYDFPEEEAEEDDDDGDEDEDASLGRDGDANDDVPDSDSDYYEDEPDFSAGVRADNNHSTSFKNITKFKRSSRQNKVKNKRVCESGKFCTLSPALQKFLGVPHLTRIEVVKRLWNYVRDKNLQDPQDGKNIICDETLRELFAVDSINILRIHKALTKHIWPSVKTMRREKPREKPRKLEKEDSNEAKLKVNPPRKVYSGFLAPLPLSDTLIKFLGTGETELTRAMVIKRVWEYIKDNNLQDPYEKKTVICDEKLKELVNVDSFHGFMVSKLLSAHFVKL